jgi:hypothetical protein
VESPEKFNNDEAKGAAKEEVNILPPLDQLLVEKKKLDERLTNLTNVIRGIEIEATSILTGGEGEPQERAAKAIIKTPHDAGFLLFDS